VCTHLLCCHALVVRAVQHLIAAILLEDVWVIANALDEDEAHLAAQGSSLQSTAQQQAEPHQTGSCCLSLFYRIATTTINAENLLSGAGKHHTAALC
jgi:hypothetical protein